MVSMASILLFFSLSQKALTVDGYDSLLHMLLLSFLSLYLLSLHAHLIYIYLKFILSELSLYFMTNKKN